MKYKKPQIVTLILGEDCEWGNYPGGACDTGDAPDGWS